MTDKQVKDDANAVVDEQLGRLDDAERLFVAIGAVASGKLANRVSDHMREIREQREVMFSCQSLFGAANEVGF